MLSHFLVSLENVFVINTGPRVNIRHWGFPCLKRLQIQIPKFANVKFQSSKIQISSCQISKFQMSSCQTIWKQNKNRKIRSRTSQHFQNSRFSEMNIACCKDVLIIFFYLKKYFEDKYGGRGSTFGHSRNVPKRIAIDQESLMSHFGIITDKNSLKADSDDWGGGGP